MKGLINLDSGSVSQNTPGLKTEIFSYEIPVGNVFLFEKDDNFKFHVPTRVEKIHGGAGDEEFDLAKTYVDSTNTDADSNALVVDGAGLIDDLTVIAVTKTAGTILTLKEVDYTNNKATIEHDTEEQIYIYFLFGNGQFNFDIVSPISNGALSKTIFDLSAYDVHSVNQFKKESPVQIEGRSWPVPESYYLKLFYEGDVTIYWPTTDPVSIANFNLRYRAADRNNPVFDGNKKRPSIEERLNNLLIS